MDDMSVSLRLGGLLQPGGFTGSGSQALRSSPTHTAARV